MNFLNGIEKIYNKNKKTLFNPLSPLYSLISLTSHPLPLRHSLVSLSSPPFSTPTIDGRGEVRGGATAVACGEDGDVELAKV